MNKESILFKQKIQIKIGIICEFVTHNRAIFMNLEFYDKSQVVS